MANRAKLKEAFEAETEYGAFFTGGSVEWTNDSKQLFCQNGSTLHVLDIDSGKVSVTIGDAPDSDGNEGDTINSFIISPDNETVVTSHKSGLIKLWTRDGILKKTWRSIHKGPISKLAINKVNILATGGSDGAIRLWNTVHQACTHNLKGSQGVISVLKYHPNFEINQIFAAADDVKIRCWDVSNGSLIFTLSGHFSKVTSLSFYKDDFLVSSGRDKVLILWDLKKHVAKKTLPIYESIEDVVVLPYKAIIPNLKLEDGIFVACIGEKGVIKIWNIDSSKLIYTQENSLVNPAKEDGGLGATQLLYNNLTNYLCVVTVDHNIIIHDMETFNCIKQFIGFSDEILDAVFIGENDSHIAVATNSSDIKIYNVETMNCQLLKGHTDIVLSLAKCPVNVNLLLSSGKDNSIRLWKTEPSTFEITCIGVGTRHTASVGSVAFSQTSSNFCATVSQDMCLKLWEIPSENKFHQLDCTYTEKAHDKDINYVSVSPNDKLIATASQDKTARIWSADNLSLLGTLRGHRRGIWCVKFSPVDQVILTTSADCMVKLWSINELNCLKTIEGHESSILKGEFISRGMQLLTAGADGLIKLWNIKDSECVATLDKHESRIWTIAISSNENFIFSGGSDSLLIKWKDVTVDKKIAEIEKNEELALQEQELSNLIQSNQLLKALKVALKLDRPYQVLKIIETVVKTGEANLPATIKQLNNESKELLFKTALKWNTNSKHCQEAQLILNILLRDMQSGDFRPEGITSLIESALPYTERHFRRLTRVTQDLNFIDYLVKKMEYVKTET